MKQLWKNLKQRIEHRPSFQTIEADRAIEAATNDKYTTLQELAKEVSRLEEIARKRSEGIEDSVKEISRLEEMNRAKTNGLKLNMTCKNCYRTLSPVRLNEDPLKYRCNNCNREFERGNPEASFTPIEDHPRECDCRIDDESGRMIYSEECTSEELLKYQDENSHPLKHRDNEGSPNTESTD